MVVVRERFENNVVDTLNEPGNITAAQTTITVDTGTLFPANGDFRLLIDSEIMIGTARATNDITVTRGAEGTTAAIHNDAATVTLIFSGGGIEKYIDDAVGGHTVRQSVYRMSDEAGDPLTESSFTWLNQGTATAADDGKGGILMTMPSEVSHVIRGKYLSLPSTPFKMTALVQVGPGTNESGVNGAHMGLFLRESSTGKLILQACRVDDKTAMWYFTSPTAFGSTIDTTYPWSGDRMWVSIEDDGTNIRGAISVDGINFLNLWTDLRTAKFAGGANQIGFYCNSGSSVTGAYFHFHGIAIDDT